MNTQNKLYKINFSHLPMTSLQPVHEQQTQNAKLSNFWEFPKKVWTHRQEDLNWQKRESADSFLPPGLPSFINRAWCLWHGIFPLASLAGYVPSQHLHTCSLAEHGRLEKVLDFIATTETISVINILLILNHTKSY